MDEREDNLARLYRHAAREEPPAQVDLAVMDQARRALRQRSWSPFGGHWLAMGAVAAVTLLSVVLVTLMQGQPDPTVLQEATAPVAQAPVAGDGRIHLSLPPAGARRAAEPEAASSAPATAQRAAGTGPEAALAGKAAADAVDSGAAAPAGASGPPPPRFDFYRTLPEMQVEAPPPATAPEPATPAAALTAAQSPATTVAVPAAPATDNHPLAPAAAESTAQPAAAPPAAVADESAAAAAAGYYLQVGAFRAADAAERFRTRLADLKYPAGVESIRLANGEIWYRVRVGPYRDSTAMQAVQARLKAQGIDSMPVRVDGSR